MRRLILGTAGHIDHGKTALVKRLTGVDTDRLKEEKERGITVDLGFAELTTSDGTHFGVVDVPGHEGFIRNMVAGATGVDLVLLVVAADEGVMPQTREHLAIVRLLGVPRLLVALTKADLVEDEWLELVSEEVRELLEPTPYREAPLVPVSVVSDEGIGALQDTLMEMGRESQEKEAGDLARLPVDRVFTIKGAGTIVTGTLWTGELSVEDRVRLLPGEQEARVRSLQLHGQEVRRAPAGSRVAVGLTGSGIHHHALARGQTLVGGAGWESSWMLTCRLSILPDTGWELEQGQRVRVHLGTAEVLARAAVLEGEKVPAGGEGWVQLRLEEPVLARARDHLVIRAYSPVTTIGGGRVVEVLPRKQRRLAPGEGGRLSARLGSDEMAALGALLESVGWEGVAMEALPHRLGLPPSRVADLAGAALREGQGARASDRLYAPGVWDEGRRTVLSALGEFHTTQPLRPGLPLQELRQVFPTRAGAGLGEAIIQELTLEEAIHLGGGLARLFTFSPTLSDAQEKARSKLRLKLVEGDLSPPSPTEMASGLGLDVGEAERILRLMESQGEVLCLEGGLFFSVSSIREGGLRVISALGGRSGLGPADFREVLGVSRKYLLPILRYMDTVGITTRINEEREVSGEAPAGWGTSQGRARY